MTPIEPLSLSHSWPLFELEERFDLGRLVGCTLAGVTASALPSLIDRELARVGIGLWECDLSDNALTWSPEVYDLFGLPRDASPARAVSVSLYCEHSRAAMERLRAHAIAHRRGFTLDAEIRPAQGARRWMRLVTAPVCEGRRVLRLQGLKQDVTHEYARGSSRR